MSEEYTLDIYCIDCRLFFNIGEATWTEDNIWLLCPECKGQNYTIRRKDNE